MGAATCARRRLKGARLLFGSRGRNSPSSLCEMCLFEKQYINIFEMMMILHYLGAMFPPDCKRMMMIIIIIMLHSLGTMFPPDCEGLISLGT